jgi:hypothetical protein
MSVPLGQRRLTAQCHSLITRPYLHYYDRRLASTPTPSHQHIPARSVVVQLTAEPQNLPTDSVYRNRTYRLVREKRPGCGFWNTLKEAARLRLVCWQKANCIVTVGGWHSQVVLLLSTEGTGLLPVHCEQPPIGKHGVRYRHTTLYINTVVRNVNTPIR